MAEPLPPFRLKPANLGRDKQRAALREYWLPILAQAVLSAHRRGELIAPIAIQGYASDADLKAAVGDVLEARGYTVYQSHDHAFDDRLTISWAQPIFMATESGEDAGVLPHAHTLESQISEDAVRLFGPDLETYMDVHGITGTGKFSIRDEEVGLRRGLCKVQTGRLRVYMFLLKQAGYNARFQEPSPLDPADIGLILVEQ